MTKAGDRLDVRATSNCKRDTGVQPEIFYHGPRRRPTRACLKTIRARCQSTTVGIILLKTYESQTDGRVRFNGHTAFADPSSPPDAPARKSV